MRDMSLEFPHNIFGVSADLRRLLPFNGCETHTGTVSNRMSFSAAGGGGAIFITKPRQKPKP